MPELAQSGREQPGEPVPPREAGAVLVALGGCGLFLPGLLGLPLMVLGGLTFAPQLYIKSDHWLARRFPELHHRLSAPIARFVVDFAKRYPDRA